MRSLFEKKPWVLLLSVLAVGALMVLSVSLRDVSFDSAQPIGWGEAESPESSPLSPLRNIRQVEMPSQILLIVALLMLVALVAMLLSPEGRKRLLRVLFRTAFTLWALYFLYKRYPQVFNFLDPTLQGAPPASPSLEAGSSVPPPVFTPPQDSPWLSYMVSLFIILSVLFIAWRLYVAWRALNQPSGYPLQELARIARRSLRDLSDGRESTDVIMNCYFRMSDAVSDSRHLERGSSMTPAEFASRLEEAGLPGDAVRRLTRLFESVRYGAHKAGPKDVNEAVACLTTILQYCGETA